MDKDQRAKPTLEDYRSKFVALILIQMITLCKLFANRLSAPIMLFFVTSKSTTYCLLLYGSDTTIRTRTKKLNGRSSIKTLSFAEHVIISPACLRIMSFSARGFGLIRHQGSFNSRATSLGLHSHVSGLVKIP